jgi:sterol desaturase/sphingolipid hydroxylase (fatty acid hydroxylase superfamily)
MMSPLSDYWGSVQTWLFETLIQPLLYAGGGMAYLEQAYDGVEWFMVGMVEVALIATLGMLLERAFAVERIDGRSPQVAVDRIYTLLHRSGLFSLGMFFILTPLFDGFEALLRSVDINRPNLEDFLPDNWRNPWLIFLGYLLVLDGVDYWIHRAQHRWAWWWGLHSLHHSQQEMTVWSDNRNHLLDDALRDAIMAFTALLIGLPPGQFIWVVVLTRLMQSFQHGNFRISLGWLGDRLVVAPWFHRVHHSIADDVSNSARGHNFAVLFPVWDLIFGTADMKIRYEPTGIADQHTGRNYGQGFWDQQRKALGRMLGWDRG